MSDQRYVTIVKFRILVADTTHCVPAFSRHIGVSEWQLACLIQYLYIHCLAPSSHTVCV